VTREFEDDLGRRWEAFVEEGEGVPAGVAAEAPSEDWVLVFTSADGDRELAGQGPVQRALPELSDDRLRELLEGAHTGTGRLLVDPDLRPWWVRSPEEAPQEEGAWAVQFTSGDDQLTHEGPLRAGPHELSEDELLELLDEARGDVLLPMDVTGDSEQ